VENATYYLKHRIQVGGPLKSTLARGRAD